MSSETGQGNMELSSPQSLSWYRSLCGGIITTSVLPKHDKAF
jgi:hypothetical protein